MLKPCHSFARFGAVHGDAVNDDPGKADCHPVEGLELLGERDDDVHDLTRHARRLGTLGVSRSLTDLPRSFSNVALIPLPPTSTTSVRRLEPFSSDCLASGRLEAGCLAPLLALSVFRLFSFGIKTLLARRLVLSWNDLSPTVGQFEGFQTRNGRTSVTPARGTTPFAGVRPDY